MQKRGFRGRYRWITFLNNLACKPLSAPHEVEQSLNMLIRRGMFTSTARSTFFQPKRHQSYLNRLHQSSLVTSHPPKRCYSRFSNVLRLNRPESTIQKLGPKILIKYIYINIQEGDDDGLYLYGENSMRMTYKRVTAIMDPTKYLGPTTKHLDFGERGGFW